MGAMASSAIHSRQSSGVASTRSMRFLWCGIAALAASSLLGACSDDEDASATDSSGTEAPEAWPAPPDALAATRAAGLEPERREQLATHRHTHLDILLDGTPVEVPAGIGINIADPGVTRFDDPAGVSFGGIEECDEPCISPLHTHDTTGMIHTESDDDRLLTLGQLFTEWGVKLDESCVGDYCRSDIDIAVYLDGVPHRGNPSDIELADGLEIAVVIGSPPEEIPDDADFSDA
jgi:hypothetical protein